ncbi:ABC-type glycerol-3-phosphate transport system substrate-binding protein [Arthrobacter globiformis]|nr:ABC-type glycerol-3-phosphate transport system substrate-binding protein [Arthrobacter globiformis]
MTIKGALAAGAVLLTMSGCSSGPASSEPAPSASESSATALRFAPVLNDTQQKSLVSEVRPLAPQLAEDKLIYNSRYVCTQALRGSRQKSLVATADRLFTTASDPITPDEAVKLVAAVQKNGFCK